MKVSVESVSLSEVRSYEDLNRPYSSGSGNRSDSSRLPKTNKNITQLSLV